MRLFRVFLIAAAAILPVFSQTFTNPTFKNSDPWIIHEGDKYYFSYGCHGTAICVKTSTTLTGIAAAPDQEVWKAPPTGPNRAEIWAPEIHKVNGHWYIYYAADNGGNDNHRLFALQALSDDPVGNYVMGETGGPQGEIMESSGHWAIDPDVFTATDGNLYLTWSCTNSPKSTFPQNICLAKMKDPLHTDGQTVEISNPTEPWEKRVAAINEGPVGFVHDGKNFITYSGSASFSPNAYTVGLLTNGSGNLMDPDAWVKTGPIFDNHGKAIGTGSVVFTTSPDGSEWWNLYHGIDRMDCTPTPYQCRDIRMQPMLWGLDGEPVLGYPYDPGVPIPVPSGEPGSTRKTRPVVFGQSFGDAAEGHPENGVVKGEWETNGRGPMYAKSMGPGVMRIFALYNPNLPSFTITTELKLDKSGTTPSHFYGLFAAYVDARNNVAFVIDPVAKTLVSLVNGNGNALPPLSCPLSPDFDPATFHTLKIVKTGTNFVVTVDSVAPKGPCNGRTLFIENGQAGLLTEDAEATFRHYDIIPPVLPPPHQSPASTAPPVTYVPPGVKPPVAVPAANATTPQ